MARTSTSRSPERERERASYGRREHDDGDYYKREERSRRYRDEEDPEDGAISRPSKVARRDRNESDGRDGRERDSRYGRETSYEERYRKKNREADRDRGDRDREHRRREDVDESGNRRIADRNRDRDGYRERERERERDRRPGSREPYRDRDRERDAARDRDQDRQRRAPIDEDDGRRAGPSQRRSPSAAQAPDRARSTSARSEDKDKEKEDKAKPNFAPSGLLAAATKTVVTADGAKTVLKYHEPPEARKPSAGWRLYVFKGEEQTDLLHIYRQSCYLIGRDKAVVDVYVEHPSCSKQHAAIQYRQVTQKDDFGKTKPVVKPFIIDLDSTNSTLVNDEAIPASRYYELKMGDVIKFGQSTREYVLLHDEAATAA